MEFPLEGTPSYSPSGAIVVFRQEVIFAELLAVRKQRYRGRCVEGNHVGLELPPEMGQVMTI